MKKKFMIGYPLLKLQAKVHYDVMDNLSSFEKLLFEAINIDHFNLQQIFQLIPIEPKFVEFLINKHLDTGLVLKDQNSCFALTPSGKSNLATLSIKKNRETELEIFYDPFLGNCIPHKEVISKGQYDYKILLERPTNSQINDEVMKCDITSLIDDHVDDAFLSSKSITRIDFIDSPRVVTTYLTIEVVAVEGKSFFTSITLGDLPFPLTIETLLSSSFGSMLNIPKELLDELETIKNAQENFYAELLNNMKFSSDPEIQKAMELIKKDFCAYEIIVDQDHANALKQFIQMTEKEIFIASGWIKHKALASIEDLLIQKLKNPEIMVHLLYGYSLNDNRSADGAIDRLKELQKSYKNLKLYEVHEEFHCKAIVVDGKVAAIGSHNWLSNTAKTSKEWSMKIEDPEVAENIKNKLFVPSMKHAKAVA